MQLISQMTKSGVNVHALFNAGNYIIYWEMSM